MNEDHPEQITIGIFDSGVGGLSVLRAIRSLLPNLNMIYFADQAHVPYGRRQMEEIRSFSYHITSFLLEQGIDLLVVACNTASAAALKYLRQRFPLLPIVGMEPAVKPAAEQTHTKAVGILATPTTFQGELYQSLVQRYGDGLNIFPETCPGLVEEIEAGNLHGEKTIAILKQALYPMLEQNVDTVVLGCTHYPFVLPEIRKIAGKDIQVIDPAPAVARRVQTLLDQHFEEELKKNSPPSLLFYTTGEAGIFQKQIKALLGYESTVKPIFWQADGLRKT